MNKENAKLAFERNKLQKLNDEFKKLKDDDPRIDSKWNEIQKINHINPMQGWQGKKMIGY